MDDQPVTDWPNLQSYFALCSTLSEVSWIFLYAQMLLMHTIHFHCVIIIHPIHQIQTMDCKDLALPDCIHALLSHQQDFPYNNMSSNWTQVLHNGFACTSTKEGDVPYATLIKSDLCLFLPQAPPPSCPPGIQRYPPAPSRGREDSPPYPIQRRLHQHARQRPGGIHSGGGVHVHGSAGGVPPSGGEERLWTDPWEEVHFVLPHQLCRSGLYVWWLRLV